MAVDVARGLKVGMPRREERLWPTELEPQHPRLWIIYCEGLFIIGIVG
jgi:hypothetical protein